MFWEMIGVIIGAFIADRLHLGFLGAAVGMGIFWYISKTEKDYHLN